MESSRQKFIKEQLIDPFKRGLIIASCLAVAVSIGVLIIYAIKYFVLARILGGVAVALVVIWLIGVIFSPTSSGVGDSHGDM